MLDWRRVVGDLEGFKKALQNRRMKVEQSEEVGRSVSQVSAARLTVQKESEALKARRNQISQDVANLIKQGRRADAQGLIDEGKALGETISGLETKLQTAEVEFRKILEVIPNWPHSSVPVGHCEADNPVVRTWGEKRKFDFTPKSHDEIGTQLGMIDFERAGKISGARFAFLRSGVAQLERALTNFMLDLHRENGYREISPPYLVTESTMYNIGQLPKFREDVYKIEGQDKFLIPTSEVPVTAYFAGEILDEEQLPVKFVSFSPCFRSEAGSHGQDTKGLIRQHQFHKVEMVKFTHPEKSLEALEQMVSDAERVLQKLEIPFRTIHLCTGDMGPNSQKTYDIEVWLPGSVHGSEERGCYREISSCSDCGDFQARRASIRFKSKGAKTTQFLHTLNGSGLAVGRTLIAVLENYQQADGSVKVPKILQPYMNGLEVIKIDAHHQIF